MSVVHVVHCIDTEGPLSESLDATFVRLNEIFGIDLPPERKTLRALQNREVFLDGKEEAVARVFSPALLSYMDDWGKIDAMLQEVLAPDYRGRMRDSFGGHWIYNWFLLDHAGFTDNPRSRTLGFHSIFDHYRQMIGDTGVAGDGVHFHFHPLPFNLRANAYARHYSAAGPVLYEILARRIIDRMWFPAAYRPGFNTERPDSHLFLEQFIPVDFANQATGEDDGPQRDVTGGRFGDWRRARRDWQPYHPSHDDYQQSGSCRRWIFRCLNVGTRLRLLRQEDVDQAFAEAAKGTPTVLAFTHHDFRDMRPDIDQVQTMLRTAAARFPDTPFRFSEAITAARAATGRDSAAAPLRLDCRIENNVLHVEASRDTFGPQPYFAMRTREGRYFHDSFDIHTPFRSWSYVFDDHSFPLEALSHVGIASADSDFNVTVRRLDVVADRWDERIL